MTRIHIANEKDTEKLGEKIGRQVKPGTVIALDGDEPRECDASRGGCRFELESGRHTVRRMTRA